MTPIKLTVSLLDADADYEPSDATIEITDGGIVITPVGYGDNNSPDGEGVPILFEFRNGIPFLAIWADINREDSTHVISLEDAAESKRRTPENCTHTGRRSIADGIQYCKECGLDLTEEE